MDDVLPGTVEKTLPMSVANTGFMLDRLGQDCSPLQYLRELTQNSIEAILRLPEPAGEIVWDVDWALHDLNQVYKLSVVDDGDGMTGDDMVRYINNLSSSVSLQSHEGNFGVGAKIAAATRNHAGLLYQSWRDGLGSMIHMWRDPRTVTYGLRQFQRLDGSYAHWVRIEDSLKPAGVESHGTKVVLLGNTDDQNTMIPPEGTAAPSRWIARYLNTRYYRFPDGITVKAREGWENPRVDKDRNLLRTVVGQARYLTEHSVHSGTVQLTHAKAHWWILKDEDALSQNSGYINSSGHAAALYQDELYETVAGRAGVARLQMFGVIFGYPRVVLYVEPESDENHKVQANTARTMLVLNGEALPWAEWAVEFRENMPPEIKELMDEVTAGSFSSDHRQAIRDRLKQIKDLMRLSRYKLSRRGSVLIDDKLVAGGQPSQRDKDQSQSGRGGGGGGGRAGNVYGLFIAPDGSPADPVKADLEPEVLWISVEDGTRDPTFLADRAAKYLPDQHLLQINADFRAFGDMVDRWSKQYPAAARDVIEDVVREWFEQALIEAVLGVVSLKGSQEWPDDHIAKAWSEEALTAAVMPRYHIDVAVRRALGSKLGSLKQAS
jgi:hypothetical protein